jgi:hypothetical protein
MIAIAHFMKNENAEQQKLRAAVMHYGNECLPRLRRMEPRTLQALLEAVEAINQSQPLRYMQDPRFRISQWDAEQPLSGPQVIALYVFGLWVQADEDPASAPALVAELLAPQ